MITRQTVGEKLQAYLNDEMTLQQLVNWAEDSMVDAEFDDADVELLSDIIGRIGVADVEEFRLYWEDIAEMFERLGYRAAVELKTA